MIACCCLCLFSLHVGNVYISDYNRVRKITVGTDIISTIAGNGGTGTYSGDGGAATSASLNLPSGIVIDSSGTIYYNHYYCLFQ